MVPYPSLRDLLSFRGRINRRRFIVTVVLLALYLCLPYFLIIRTGLSLSLILFTLLIPFTWVGLATAIKRCHDMESSGWWLLIPMTVSFLDSYISGISEFVHLDILYAILLWALFLSVLVIRPGTKGDNKYGPVPS